MTRTRPVGHIDVPAARRDTVAAALPDHVCLTRAAVLARGATSAGLDRRFENEEIRK